MANEDGKSRNEAIMENMLGAENEILDPVSRNEALLLQISEKLDGAPGEPISTADVNGIIESIN